MPDEIERAAPHRWVNQSRWHRLYNSAHWKRRRILQLTFHPLCALCPSPTVATVVDHVVPHEGDPTSFYTGELQSLCEACHNVTKKREELHGFLPSIDEHGWPTDPRHPCNASPQARRSQDHRG
jgi:5-methylcytosine-specific restriction enzyme A